MLVRNTRNVWDMKYDVSYCVVQVVGRQLELRDKNSQIHKVNVQAVKITYTVNELIKSLPDDKAFRGTAKYHAHPKQIEDLHWSLNSNVIPDI